MRQRRHEFYGTKGQLFLSRRGKLQVVDSKSKPIAVNVELSQQNDVLHVKNFCDAIRGEAKLNADALVGHLSSSLAHLANIATRVGRSFVFDPQTEQIVGDDEANKLVGREYRSHWGTPRHTNAAFLNTLPSILDRYAHEKSVSTRCRQAP